MKVMTSTARQLSRTSSLCLAFFTSDSPGASFWERFGCLRPLAVTGLECGCASSRVPSRQRRSSSSSEMTKKSTPHVRYFATALALTLSNVTPNIQNPARLQSTLSFLPLDQFNQQHSKHLRIGVHLRTPIHLAAPNCYAPLS